MSDHSSDTYRDLLSQICTGEGKISPRLIDDMVAERVLTRAEGDSLGMELYRLKWESSLNAYIDELTGLGNRKLFNQKLKEAYEDLSRRGRKDDPGAILVIIADLNYLKWFNDHFGHQIGDRVIKYVAERIKSELRNSDTVARWGGDEFGAIVLCPSNEIAHIIGQRLTNSIKAIPFSLNIKDLPANKLDNLQEGQAVVQFNILEERIIFGIRVAVGYAVLEYENIGKLTPDELVSIADNQMFANKQETH